MKQFIVAFLAVTLLLAFSMTEAQTQGKKWVVLVAGSNQYYNYRHQSDVYHAYQVFIKAGIPQDQIIVMHYDDIANNSQNPYPGTVINQPNGPNNYRGVPKDYTKDEVTPQNFLKILQGEDMGPGKKTVKSGPNDRIFVFFSDHGAPGLIAFPGMDVLHAEDLINTIQSMSQAQRYKEMVFYIEACESGSMFNGLLKDEWNVYTTTASNPFESSYACYDSSVYGTYLADCYSVDFLQDTEGNLNNLDSITFQDQYMTLQKQVNTSHVCQYGNKKIAPEPLSNFFSGLKKQGFIASVRNTVPVSTEKAEKILSRQVKEHWLKRMIERTGKAEFKKELEEHKRQELSADVVFGALSHSLELHKARAKIASLNADHCYTQTLDVFCMKSSVQAMEKYCGKFNEANIKYASYLRDACTVAAPEDIANKLMDICSVAKL